MKSIQWLVTLIMALMIPSSLKASANVEADTTKCYAASIAKDSVYRFDTYLKKNDSLGYSVEQWEQPKILAFYQWELFPLADEKGNLIWRDTILPTESVIKRIEQVPDGKPKKGEQQKYRNDTIAFSIFGEQFDCIHLDTVSSYNIQNEVWITRYSVDTAAGYDSIEFVFPVRLKDPCYLINESANVCIRILREDSVFRYSLKQLGINERKEICEFRIHPSGMLPTYFSYPLDVKDGGTITWSSRDLFIMWLSKHFILGWIVTLCLGVFFIIIVVLLFLKVVKVSCRHKKERRSNPYVDKLVELRGNIKTSIEELRKHMQVFSIPPDMLKNNNKIDKTKDQVNVSQQDSEDRNGGSNEVKPDGEHKDKDEQSQKQIVDKLIELKGELNLSFNELANYILEIQKIRQELQKQATLITRQTKTDNPNGSEAGGADDQQNEDVVWTKILAELDKANQDLENEKNSTQQKVDKAVAGIQAKLDEANQALKEEKEYTQQKVKEAKEEIQAKLDEANQALKEEKEYTQQKVKEAKEEIQAKLDEANQALKEEKENTQQKVKEAKEEIQAKLDKANKALKEEKENTQQKVKEAKEEIQAKLDKANKALKEEKENTQQKVKEAKEEARKDKEAALALKDNDINQLKQDQKFYLDHFTRVGFAQTYAQQVKKLLSIVSELEKAANELGESNKMEDAYNLFKAQAKYNTNLGKLNRAAFDAEVEMISQGQLIYNESGLSKYEKAHPEEFMKKYFFNFYLEKYVNAVVVFAESLMGLHYFDSNLSEKDVEIFMDLRKKIEEQVDALGLEIATVHIMETNKYSDLDIIKRVDVGVSSNSIVGIENCKVSMKGGTKSSNRIKVILQQ